MPVCPSIHIRPFCNGIGDVSLSKLIDVKSAIPEQDR